MMILSTTIINLIQQSYTFVRDKPFGQLLDFLPKNFIFLKTFNSEFSNIEV